MKRTGSMLMMLLLSLSLLAQHTVVLKSGERMNGKVESLKDDVISFEFKGNVMKLNVAEVSSITFSETAELAKSGTSDLRLDFSTISRICWLMFMSLFAEFDLCFGSYTSDRRSTASSPSKSARRSRVRSSCCCSRHRAISG